jgi:hypothetical protein
MLKTISTVCVLFAISMLASTATAGSLIDEDFATNNINGFMGSMIPVDPGLAGQWITGSTTYAGEWSAPSGFAESLIHGMTPPDSVGGLLYYAAKPVGPAGWGGNKLNLSFVHREPVPVGAPEGVAYTLLGWHGPSAVEVSDPTGTGVMFAMGPAIPAPNFTPITDEFTGDLSPFEFIGVLFTNTRIQSIESIGNIDDVSLTVTPEPVTMSLLAVGGVALLRRRRRRRRRRA